MKQILSHTVPALLAAAVLSGACNKHAPAVVDRYQRLRTSTRLSRLAGKKVYLDGRVSKTPWQHLVSTLAAHHVVSYVDWEGGQMVVFSQKRLPRNKPLRIFGTIHTFTGKDKGGEPWTVHQLKAERWETR